MENKEKEPVWKELEDNPIVREVNSRWVIRSLWDIDNRLIRIEATYLTLKWTLFVWCGLDVVRIILQLACHYGCHSTGA